MYLITGGRGFLGSALARRLVRRGEKVRIIDDLSRGATATPGSEFYEGDVCDREFVRYMMAGVDTVIHMAAINGTANFYERPWDVLRVGILGTFNVLEAAGDAKVRRIQYFSSSEVYQQPEHLPTPESERAIIPDFANPRYSYGGSKIAGELLTINFCRSRGIGWQIIRPHNVYGPGMPPGHVIADLADRLRLDSGVLPIQGSGAQTRTFCYIDDMVAGILTALDLGTWQDTYNVGATEEVSVIDLARRVARAMGLSPVIIPGPPQPGETSRRCPDISKLQSLGYKPRVSLDEGLRLTVAA